MQAKSIPYREFAKRLHAAFDRTLVRTGRSRVTEAAAQFGVSRETSRLWFAGSAMPELQRLIEIADFCRVSLDWLARGMGEIEVSPHRVADDARGRYDVPLDHDERAILSAVRALEPRRRIGLLAFLTL